MLNGTDDAVVPWEGEPPGTEYRLLSVPESIALWAGMNDCGGDAPVSTPIEADSAGGIRVTYEAYQGCPGTIEQGLYAIEGGAHIWPSPYFAANDSIASFLLRQLRR